MRRGEIHLHLRLLKIYFVFIRCYLLQVVCSGHIAAKAFVRTPRGKGEGRGVTVRMHEHGKAGEPCVGVFPAQRSHAEHAVGKVHHRIGRHENVAYTAHVRIHIVNRLLDLRT